MKDIIIWLVAAVVVPGGNMPASYTQALPSGCTAPDPGWNPR